MNNPEPSSNAYQLKYKIAISGAAETEFMPPDLMEKVTALGTLIAKRGMVLVTGATTGAPYWAANMLKSFICRSITTISSSM